ncbi:MFS general substrate transporter [Lentinus tigrinus ALCF2SS1-7]|uniref:MFS general substrate transporter n=1 Tax=Lentinus tigrinus ALCF2SS1-6 TaxID=1328759 RepID=A0A5C2SQV2_9APHY|nr:MFS general substrate transporter [Lentinus tigrinus ALCF2SS1-6]RPD78879.1 MFS general substrate transporter [Lentinus tigrinus ALCF2SS1-7]
MEKVELEPTSSAQALGPDEKEVESQDIPIPPAAPTFPEGGLAAWLTVIGGSMVLFCTFGAIQSFGVYQDYYTRVYLAGTSTPSQVSWIGSVQVFLLFALSLPSGKLFDEGYFHPMMILASILYVVSLFMLSLAHSHEYYQIILSQGVAVGIAYGILFIPALSVSSHYFRVRRSSAMGVVFAGSSIGGVIYPIMLNQLFNGKAGFVWGVRAAAILGIVLLTIANLLMRTRLPSRKHRKTTFTPSIRRIVTDLPFMICAIGGFLVFWGLFFPFFYLQLFANVHGVSPNLARYTISILNGASLFGRTIPNFLADVWGPFNVIIPMTAISGCLIFAMFGATSDGALIAFAILYGFFSGGFISLIAPCAASFSVDVGEVGTRIGVICFIVGFALLTGNPIGGALLKSPHYEWQNPILFSSITVLAGAATLVLSRQLAVRKRRTQRL